MPAERGNEEQTEEDEEELAFRSEKEPAEKPAEEWGEMISKEHSMSKDE